MDLSYAQNLEDVHLAQVFVGEPPGFYIDVGAGHPVADNVSFWSYLQGWRGLVVEPQPSLCELYRHVWPRDTAVCSLVGGTIGETDFHVVDRLHGFSTMLEAHAAAAAAFGAGYSTRRVPATTLAALCGAHAVTAIDFLKVDVKGAEADVLAGADWQRWRPRVVLVEAVAPGTMAEAWHDWEPALLAQGYRFAFFDGLNRFYVAQEAAALEARFPVERTAWDAVRHLYEFGRAADSPAHPDHALARALVTGFLARVPALDPEWLRDLLVRPAGAGAQAPMRPEDADALIGTDAFRAALGRIAAGYDGGQLMDE